MKDEYTIQKGYLPYNAKLANSVERKESQKKCLTYTNENTKEKYLRELTAKGFLKNLDSEKLYTKESMLNIIKKTRMASNNKNAESFLESIVGIDFIYTDYVTGWDFFESNGTRHIKSFRIKTLNTCDDKKYYGVQLVHHAFERDDC